MTQPMMPMQEVALQTPANHVTAPGGLLAQKQQEGWSPSKIESLSHFLATTAKAPPGLATSATTPHLALPPLPQSSAIAGQSRGLPQAVVPLSGGADLATEAPRPYLGLKYLLRSGPDGSGAPKTWTDLTLGATGGGPSDSKARLQLPGRAPTAPGGRFAPYALPPPRAARRYVDFEGIS